MTESSPLHDKEFSLPRSPDIETKLCVTCRIVFRNIARSSFERTKDSFPWHSSFELMRQASSECDVCSEVVYRFFSNLDEIPIYLRVSYTHTRDGRATELKIWGEGIKREVNLGSFSLFVRDLPSKQTSQIFEGREISEIPNPAIASDWLQECIQNPSLCRASWQQQAGASSGSSDHPESSFCPTRLIDVGTGEGDSIPHLVVIERGERKSQEPISWVALSHRWGLGSPLTTTTKNISQLQEGIPFKSLPRTFRDAITVTQQLGQRYLWIDSLCILQDSKEDWTREASMMEEVFGKSLLTIAAHNAPDCGSGILTRRKKPDLTVHSVSALKGLMNAFLLSKEPKVEIFLTTNLLSWAESAEGQASNLSSRGWVLQESILSPRTLLYCQQQMFWECRTMVRAEGSRSPLQVIGNEGSVGEQLDPDQTAYPFEPSTRNLGGLLSRLGLGQGNQSKVSGVEAWLSKKSVLFLPNISSEEIYKTWEVIVEDYSSRQLTQPDDRLQAIAGLAAHFERRLDSPFVAGVFRDSHLHYALLWRVSYRKPGRTPTPAYHRAPTWSWLAIEGSVLYDTVTRSQREPLDQESIAEIQFPAPSKCPQGPLGSPRSQQLKVTSLWRDSSEYEFADRCSAILILSDPDRISSVMCKFDFLDQDAIWSRARERRFGILVIIPGYGLLLEPTADPMTYRRIGVATIDSPNMSRRGQDGRSEWIERTITID